MCVRKWSVWSCLAGPAVGLDWVLLRRGVYKLFDCKV